MDKVGLTLLVFLVAAAATHNVGDAQTCNACNCQFNNVQVLSQLIEKQVNQKLADEPRKLLPDHDFKKKHIIVIIIVNGMLKRLSIMTIEFTLSCKIEW